MLNNVDMKGKGMMGDGSGTLTCGRMDMTSGCDGDNAMSVG